MATTRVPFHQVSYQGLLEMTGQLPQAARILAETRPGVIAVASFTGSCLRGSEIVNMIQQATGIPTLVPALELARILNLLGAERIAMVTCFSQELRTLEQLFFKSRRIEIVKFLEAAAQPEDPFQVSRVDDEQILEQLRREDFRGVDAVVVDLPAFVIGPELQARLDRFLRVPVLNMARVLLWSALEAAGAPTGDLYLTKLLPRARPREQAEKE